MFSLNMFLKSLGPKHNFYSAGLSNFGNLYAQEIHEKK